ncbi:hypothetical protein HCN44_002229 [Aphidius gifuensis]|uniref:Large ribosomal subunit protein mL49 n=1 Tax=Aphidius gifuensis TaxID=684658 RepID=A0A834XZR1_APHGI|nr:probable 39S ribosomal protein L49, mitochondrial [Aphidius gifuensis]KAF7996583.1 hypothetical protein HCN44_002229 [Aphidius gifuensis]
MAALRNIGRFVLSTKNYNSCKFIDNDISQFGINQVVKRWARFENSPMVQENIDYTDFEVIKDPKSWSYVERCMKSKYIPEPPKNAFDGLPSGWRAQNPESRNNAYFIERSKNHQLAVYLKRRDRGLRRLTTVRKIQGDIVALEAELREHLEKITGDKIGSQILEPHGVIHFRGDYVTKVRQWLESKGF